MNILVAISLNNYMITKDGSIEQLNLLQMLLVYDNN